MKLLVTGDRYWRSIEAVVREFSFLPKDTIVVHGAAMGADTLCDIVAKEMGYEVRSYPAEWDRYHNSAGPIRNRKMLDTEHPDACIAFHEDIKRSKGTADMINYCKQKGVPVKLVER
jgi:hypothetical protein